MMRSKKRKKNNRVTIIGTNHSQIEIREADKRELEQIR